MTRWRTRGHELTSTEHCAHFAKAAECRLPSEGKPPGVWARRCCPSSPPAAIFLRTTGRTLPTHSRREPRGCARPPALSWWCDMRRSMEDMIRITSRSRPHSLQDGHRTFRVVTLSSPARPEGGRAITIGSCLYRSGSTLRRAKVALVSLCSGETAMEVSKSLSCGNPGQIAGS